MLDPGQTKKTAAALLRYHRGEPPLPEVIIETDDEAEPEEKNLLKLVVEKKARIDAVLFNSFPRSLETGVGRPREAGPGPSGRQDHE